MRCHAYLHLCAYICVLTSVCLHLCAYICVLTSVCLHLCALSYQHFRFHPVLSVSFSLFSRRMLHFKCNSLSLAYQIYSVKFCSIPCSILLKPPVLVHVYTCTLYTVQCTQYLYTCIKVYTVYCITPHVYSVTEYSIHVL